MVDEGLRGIASSGGKNCFVGVGRYRIGVVGEKIAQVEGKWCRFVHGDGSIKRQDRVGGVQIRASETYSRPVAVESAVDAAPSMSIAPPLIFSASCECVSEVTLNATPPLISVSDMV